MTDDMNDPAYDAQDPQAQWSPPPPQPGEWTPPQAQWSPPSPQPGVWTPPQAQWSPPSPQPGVWTPPQAQWSPPPPPPVGPAFGYDRAPQSPNRSRKKVWLIAGAAALLVGGAVTATVLVLGGGSGPVGYNDPAKLSADVSLEMNARVLERGYDFSVTSVDCIKEQARNFTCHVEYSDGDASTLSVTVSEDGNTWISHAQ